MNIVSNLILALVIFVAIGGCVEGRQDIGPEVKQTATGLTEEGASIAAIVADRETYIGKSVTVAGKVLPGLAFEFVGDQPYQIIQGESRLWVITHDMSPAEGAFVTVRGKIVAPYQIKGRSYQLVLLEEERR